MYEDITHREDKPMENMAAVPSIRGGGAHGHAGMVLSSALSPVSNPMFPSPLHWYLRDWCNIAVTTAMPLLASPTPQLKIAHVMPNYKNASRDLRAPSPTSIPSCPTCKWKSTDRYQPAL